MTLERRSEIARIPRTRGDCVGGERPCPFVRCAHHLTHIARRGFRLTETCSLDLADRGAHTLEEVGAVLSLSRHYVATVEARALNKVRLRHGKALAILLEDDA